MLGPAGDVRRNVELVELGFEQGRRLAHMRLAIGALLVDHGFDLGVLARMQDLEGKILQLPLESVDTQAVSERRVDLQRLARLLHLLRLAQVLDRAHVVQSIGELDQDDAHVARHRHDHLAVVLGLGLLAALELNSGQLRDAFDQARDLLAELLPELGDGHAGVLDHVVQKRGGHRLLVQPKLGADLRDAERMVDELLARAALLTVVRLGGELEGAANQIPIDLRVVGSHVGE